MDTLKFIADRWNLDLGNPSPIKFKISRFLSLMKLYSDLGFKKGAEIGVCRGWYSMILCDRIPGLHLYCIDPWKSYPDYTENHHDQKGMDEYCSATKHRMRKRNCTIIRKTSMEAVKDFEDGSLDFVFIDGNHSFEYVTEDIAAWSKKVRVGGIVSGHDYFNSAELKKGLWVEKMNKQETIRLCQVKDVVDAWTKAYHVNPWFVITGDKCPTWFWVKEG